MDFHSLTRRELQTLCKKNKIPANLTNVAMVEALGALQNVEGIEEILDPSESQIPRSTEKLEIGSPEIPKTVCRTSTRRRPVKATEEPESSQPRTRTRRGTRRITEEPNQEKNDVPKTPAVPSSRKRAPATSAASQEKTEVPKTPAVPSSRKRAPATSARQKTVRRVEETSVQHAYSTRRSARLSEKMGRTEPMEIEFSKEMSKITDGDVEENKGDDLQTISEESSNKMEADPEVLPGVDMQPISEESSKIMEADSEVLSGQKSSVAELSSLSEESSKTMEADSQDLSGADLQTMSEETPKILVADSEVLSGKKSSAKTEIDCKAEPEEKSEESAISENSDRAVSDVKNEAQDEENKEAELQKNSEVNCDKIEESDTLFKILVDLDETIVENEAELQKNSDVNCEKIEESDILFKISVDLDETIVENVLNIEDLIEDSRSENEQPLEEMDLIAPPQAYGDDFEKPEPSAIVDEVECQSQVSKDFEVNVAGEEESTIDENSSDKDMNKIADEFCSDYSDSGNTEGADRRDSEDLDVDMNKNIADEFSSDYSDSVADLEDDPVPETEKADSEASVNEKLELGAIADAVECQSPVRKDSKVVNGDNAEEADNGDNVDEISKNRTQALAEEEPPLLVNFPTPGKDVAVPGRTPLSPLSGQIPRSLSNKKPSATQRKISFLSDNKENFSDKSGRKIEIKTMKKEGKNICRDTTEDVMLKKLSETSLRQLRKMFKEKLQIKENTNNNNEDNKNDAQSRTALQTLPEN